MAGNAGSLKAGSRWFVFAPDWDMGSAISPLNSNEPKTKIVKSRKEYDRQDTEYTCQSAAIAMVTGGDEMEIRRALDTMGDPGDPGVMGNYLRDRVREYRFTRAASLIDFVAAIDDGYQLLTHGYFSRSGHVIKVSGYELENGLYTFNCDDPYEQFDPLRWSYRYDGSSGNNVNYSSYVMYAACVVSLSFFDAAAIYRRGELDSSRKGAWLHMIRN